MVSPVKDISSAARSVQDSAESTLADLRDQVTQLAKEVSSIAERRTRAIRETAVDTAEAALRSCAVPFAVSRSSPWRQRRLWVPCLRFS